MALLMAQVPLEGRFMKTEEAANCCGGGKYGKYGGGGSPEVAQEVCAMMNCPSGDM